MGGRGRARGGWVNRMEIDDQQVREMRAELKASRAQIAQLVTEMAEMRSAIVGLGEVLFGAFDDREVPPGKRHLRVVRE